MLSRKFIGFSSLVSLSFGLMAGCSDDSTPTTSTTATGDVGGDVTNVCIYDGYSAMQGANGETLCMDSEGNLAFWINADGSYGFPEASPVDVCNGYTSMIGDDGTTYCFDANNQLQYAATVDGNIIYAAENTGSTTLVDSSTSSADTTTGSDSSGDAGDVSAESSSSVATCVDPVDGEVSINQIITSADGSTYMYNASCNKIVLTQPVSSSSATQQIESSASTTCAATTTPLYTINGISYYQSGQGYVYYFDENCNRVKVENSTSSSSSATSQSSSSVRSSSSAVVASSSSENVNSSTSVQSSTSVSNGSTPTITYASSGATVENNNNCVTVNGGEVVITCAGDYDFSGSYSGSDAQIRVYSSKTDSSVYLNLRGLTLTNTADAPIYTQMASKTFVVAKSGTTNTLSDASTRTKTFTYVNANNETKTDTTAGCIYSKDDLTIKGEGTLIVKGNYNNGIHTTNDLRFRGETTVNVTAANNGLKGKGLVDIEQGNLTIAATNGDAIKSDECTTNSADSCTAISDGKGYVSIKGGTITITKAGDDGIQGYNYVQISDSVSTPTIKVTSTGKGIISENRVYINGGNIDISSGNDGVHSNMNIYFNGGYTKIAAPGNDGVHADSTLMINDGTIYVTNSYEGLEAWYIKANGGITDVYGTNDAWNAAGGNDGSGNTTSSGQSNWGPGGNMQPGGGSGSSSGFLTITGGVHHAKTGSGDTDGIDSNGELTISGGVVIVECQISGGMGGSFDADGTASLTSKTVLGFSSGSSEKGTNYNVSFSTSSYYGTSYVAFKPTISGNYMVTTTDKPSQVSNVSSYSKSTTFPSGSTVYYNN